MRISKQRTAVALTAAIALASGAYALGNQAGDGAAIAANGPDAPDGPRMTFHRAGPPELSGLADRLGVEEDALDDALRDLRGDLAPDEIRGPEGGFPKELADELGTTEAKVEAALERIRARHESEHEDRQAELAEKLAERLKLDAADVQDALEDHRPRPPVPPPAP